MSEFVEHLGILTDHVKRRQLSQSLHFSHPKLRHQDHPSEELWPRPRPDFFFGLGNVSHVTQVLDRRLSMHWTVIDVHTSIR